MNLIEQKQSSKIIRFDQLNPGDIFTYAGKVYFKLASPCKLNCTELLNGAMDHFEDTVYVYELIGTLYWSTKER